MKLTEFYTLRDLYRKKLESGDKYMGVETGYDRIDELFDGLWNGKLYTISASPSVGKSMFALNMINNLLHNDKHVALYSLEMNKVSLLMRLIGMNVGVYDRKILKDFDNKELQNKVKDFEKIAEPFELDIVTDLYKPDEIKADIYTKVEQGAEIVFLDYLQNISAQESGDVEYETLTSMCRDLQAIAKELDIPVVMLSQVTKNYKSTGITDVGAKGTGAIYEVSDGYIELEANIQETFDDPTKPHIISVFVKKNRDGRIGMAKYNLTKYGLINSIALSND